MNVFELAQKYYPTLWSVDRLKILVGANRLTAEEYKTITGEDYGEGV